MHLTSQKYQKHVTLLAHPVGPMIIIICALIQFLFSLHVNAALYI